MKNMYELNGVAEMASTAVNFPHQNFLDEVTAFIKDNFMVTVNAEELDDVSADDNPVHIEATTEASAGEITDLQKYINRITALIDEHENLKKPLKEKRVMLIGEPLKRLRLTSNRSKEIHTTQGLSTRKMGMKLRQSYFTS